MNIVIVGAGSFGTALGNIIAKKRDLRVTVLARSSAVVRSINDFHINDKYFPNFYLDPGLTASNKKKILKEAEIIFLAIPSTQVINYVVENKNIFSENAEVVVLSKGFGKDSKTIFQSLSEIVSNQLVSLKGPTFAADLIHNNPSGFTIAAHERSVLSIFKNIFSNTNIYLDFSSDVVGVEVVSALKNIYAILLGIIDAYFNSANVQFLILTKAFNEMKNAVMVFGGTEETLYKYCGFGDFGLTALNDLSRNRTLGLLIGKGFLDEDSSNSVILEGKRTLNIVHEAVGKSDAFYLINELHKLFNTNYSVHEFIGNMFHRIRNDH